jgi:hypothetical protein
MKSSLQPKIYCPTLKIVKIKQNQIELQYHFGCVYSQHIIDTLFLGQRKFNEMMVDQPNPKVGFKPIKYTYPLGKKIDRQEELY